ncbi:hypothetical protein SELMODRAFT_83343 [Selaginella moellendorffii]|uniref:Cycloeucalenol cycloisomerase n=1 Tax=Selaginella moellendorffii TaxID=88036 RepID=D8R170_SELML|nr:hypothetical protein SELMODRAFT_83343 [Selaginella moellendorffii]
MELSLWLAESPSKRNGELLFLAYSPVWITILLGVIVPFKFYEEFQELEYFAVALMLSSPCIVLPFFLKSRLANLWIGIFGFAGNYFLTHYFYTILGANYTFPSWRLNNLCYRSPCTQPYFLLYHVFSSMTLRRLKAAQAKTSSVAFSRLVQFVSTAILAYLTALIEALTISNLFFIHSDFLSSSHIFPAFYKVGSLLYALYFIVSYPMFMRIDEDPSDEWSFLRTTGNALAASMLVTILLDFWRLTIGPVVDQHHHSWFQQERKLARIFLWKRYKSHPFHIL